jgi:exopolysaccharide biosynthesis polyprenyl glycosylphosphotransferase
VARQSGADSEVKGGIIDNVDTAALTADLPQPRSRGLRRRARFAGYVALALTDSVAILTGFWFAAQLRGAQWLAPGGVNLGLATLLIYLVIATNQLAFSIPALSSISESIRRSIGSFFMTVLLVAMISFLLQAGEMISRVSYLVAAIAAVFLIGIGRSLTGYYYVTRLQGRLTDILAICDGTPLPAGLPPCAVVDAGRSGLKPDLADPQALNRLAEAISRYDRVIVACPQERRHNWSTALKGTHVIGEILLSETQSLGAVGVDEFGGVETMVVSRGPLSFVNRVKKRLFDLAIAVPALIFLAPLLAIVAIAIRVESRGPVFFRQKRVGQSNALFEIFKFRSMYADMGDSAGNQSTRRDDDRITKVGRFIRATSIDELPQLINVVRGEMSIVGPRPHALGSLAGDQLFWEVSSRYWLRHALKPGITGLAQIRGQRGATHRQEDLEERLRSDLEYLNGWRLGRDVAIIFGTIRVLIHPNAY